MAAGPRGAAGPAGPGAEPQPRPLQAWVSGGVTPSECGSSCSSDEALRFRAGKHDLAPPAEACEILDTDLHGSRGPIQNVTLLLPAIASQVLPFLLCEIYMRQSYLNSSGNLNSLIHSQSRNA